jgi:KUP system potassium uptake protein
MSPATSGLISSSVGYVLVATRVDSHGGKASWRWCHCGRSIAASYRGLFGAALIYGDGAITPAISVLSALEGLEIITPAFQPYILPLTIAILVGLFVIQPGGTARIGRLFGPVTAVWFACLGILGIMGIMHEPSVLYAIDPRHGLAYLHAGGARAFLVLGAVFLCVTGAEAL